MSSLSHNTDTDKNSRSIKSIGERIAALEKFALKSSIKKVEEPLIEYDHIERLLTIVENNQKTTNETLDSHMLKILNLEAENQKLREENKISNEGITALGRHVFKMMEACGKLIGIDNR